MKKVFFTLVLFLMMIACANAQQWIQGNTLTVAWDPPTGYDSGEPLPAGTALQYRVYIAKITGTTTGTPQLMSTTQATQAAITFTEHGSYYVGVAAGILVGGVEAETSEVCWSSVASCCLNGAVFGGRWRVLVNPNGLRVVTVPK